MNPERFRNTTAGRLVPILYAKESSWAFVPNPLPPDLSPDWKLARILSDADRALGRLAVLGENVLNPRLLISPFKRREAVLSSQIEGTQADLNDLYSYEAGQMRRPIPGSLRIEEDAREVANYVKALDLGLEAVEHRPISLNLICELHKMLMSGVRGQSRDPGQFRRIQNWIGPPGSTITDATYVPPPVPEMKKALDNLEKYINTYKDPYPMLIRLAIVHYQFEAIHPFLDGNGRIGRLLIALLLIQWKLLPHPLLYLSAYFHRTREEYYNRLLAVSMEGKWYDWILYFLRGVEEQAKDSLSRARKLQALEKRWTDQLKKTKAPANALRLIEDLFQLPILTIPKVKESLGVSYPTAKSIVEKLVKAGILSQLKGSGRPKVFIAKAISETLAQS